MQLMNILYGTKRVCKKFDKRNPNERIIVAGPSKVIVSKNRNNNPLELNWLISKRTNTILTDNLISFGENKIDKNAIKNVKITYFESFFNLLSYQVIYFDYNNLHYYIGMGFSSKWENSPIVNSTEKINRKITFLHIWLIRAVVYFLISVTKRVYLNLK